MERKINNANNANNNNKDVRHDRVARVRMTSVGASIGGKASSSAAADNEFDAGREYGGPNPRWFVACALACIVIVMAMTLVALGFGVATWNLLNDCANDEGRRCFSNGRHRSDVPDRFSLQSFRTPSPLVANSSLISVINALYPSAGIDAASLVSYGGTLRDPNRGVGGRSLGSSVFVFSPGPSFVVYLFLSLEKDSVRARGLGRRFEGGHVLVASVPLSQSAFHADPLSSAPFSIETPDGLIANYSASCVFDAIASSPSLSIFSDGKARYSAALQLGEYPPTSGTTFGEDALLIFER